MFYEDLTLNTSVIPQGYTNSKLVSSVCQLSSSVQLSLIKWPTSVYVTELSKATFQSFRQHAVDKADSLQSALDTL